jgi:hypothetical protein
MESAYRAFEVISSSTLTALFKEPSRVLIFFGVISSIDQQNEFSNILSFLANLNITQSLFELCYFVPATFFLEVLDHPFVKQCQQNGISYKFLFETSVVQNGRVFLMLYMSSAPFKSFVCAQQASLLFPFKPVPKEVRFEFNLNHISIFL